MSTPTFDETKSIEHTAEAGANYRRYEILREHEEFAWAVVLLFYSALHLVEAHKCIHHPDKSLSDHREISYYVLGELSEIHEYYDELYRMSRSIRYYLRACNESQANYAHGGYTTLWMQMKELGITYEYL